MPARTHACTHARTHTHTQTGRWLLLYWHNFQWLLSLYECLVWPITTVKWPWSDHEVTMKWPCSDREVTVKWPWSDHEVTMKWTWSEHEVLLPDGRVTLISLEWSVIPGILMVTCDECPCSCACPSLASVLWRWLYAAFKSSSSFLSSLSSPPFPLSSSTLNSTLLCRCLRVDVWWSSFMGDKLRLRLERTPICCDEWRRAFWCASVCGSSFRVKSCMMVSGSCSSSCAFSSASSSRWRGRGWASPDGCERSFDARILLHPLKHSSDAICSEMPTSEASLLAGESCESTFAGRSVLRAWEALCWTEPLGKMKGVRSNVTVCVLLENVPSDADALAPCRSWGLAWLLTKLAFSTHDRCRCAKLRRGMTGQTSSVLSMESEYVGVSFSEVVVSVSVGENNSRSFLAEIERKPVFLWWERWIVLLFFTLTCLNVMATSRRSLFRLDVFRDRFLQVQVELAPLELSVVSLFDFYEPRVYVNSVFITPSGLLRVLWRHVSVGRPSVLLLLILRWCSADPVFPASRDSFLLFLSVTALVTCRQPGANLLVDVLRVVRRTTAGRWPGTGSPAARAEARGQALHPLTGHPTRRLTVEPGEPRRGGGVLVGGRLRYEGSFRQRCRET